MADSYLYGSISESFLESDFDTTARPRIARFRFFVLLVRMCCLKALLRRNFPVAVFLKRFAAPLCVFSLGMISFQLSARASSYSSPFATVWRAGARPPGGRFDRMVCI